MYFNAESRAEGLPELVMGIAVHSGQVVAGNIGGKDRMKYGVVGPAVTLAGRIESLTVGPQVLLSDATLARVRHLVRVGPPSQVAVKGVPEPVCPSSRTRPKCGRMSPVPEVGPTWAVVTGTAAGLGAQGGHR